MRSWQILNTNPDRLPKLLAREQVIDSIRSYFKTSGFREVFTPILVPTPSAEPNLEVFETQVKTATGISRRGFLIMSPEYSLKKLLSAGVGSVFEITRAFRNVEDISDSHNHEFTILEWYRVGADYRAIMADFEQLFTGVVTAVNPRATLSSWIYQGQTYDLSLPWPRYSVAEAFAKFANIDESSLLSNSLLDVAKTKGYQITPDTTWEQVFYQIFFNEIEPLLKSSNKPAFIYDYPKSEASLARLKSTDPRYAERFEVYLAGLELGNCFSELIDPIEQEARLRADLAARKSNGKTEYPMDEDFIQALKDGLPEVAGIAVGVDRLVMLATDAASIKDTLFFPGAELFNLS